MNNKKCLGPTSGWLLCESKTFPGKFYYFNVRNGDAVWTFNDGDTTIKQNNFFTDNVADKSHNYPEPTTLPDDHTVLFNKIGKTIKPEYTNTPLSHVKPIFGQPAFSKFTSNADTKITNVVWTPVQVPMPVCWNVESKKPTSDKITQTSEYKQEILVQSCEVPLSKRFVNNQRNSMINKTTNFETSTPIIVTNVTSNPFNECVPTVFQPKTPDVSKCNGKSVFVFGDKVESGTEIQEIDQKQDVLKNLDSNDLRFHLLAKRKKSADPICETAERNKLKTQTEVPTCKKVTFDLVDDDLVTDETSSELISDDFKPPSKTQATSTTDLDKPAPKLNTPFKKMQTFKEPEFLENTLLFKNKKIWFMAVDTEVLLLDFEAIEAFVKTDPTCKLLIPHVVQADIETICMGTCDGQQRVLNARQITRKLAIPPPYFLVEPPHNEDCFEMTTESILNCCMKAIKSNYYVILITNDPHLKNRASILNIPSYKLNEIKDGAPVKPDLTAVTVKITRQNDDIDKRNEVDENRFNFGSEKKQLFLDSDDFVGFDKLIDITKPKCVKDYDYKSDNESISSDISRDLNLKEKILSDSENVHHNPFMPQNGRKKLCHPVFDATNLKKTIQNSKFDFEKPSVWDFDTQKKEQETLFNSNPNSNLKKTPKSIFDIENLSLENENLNPFLPKPDTIKNGTSNSKYDFEKSSTLRNFDLQVNQQEILPSSSNLKLMKSMEMSEETDPSPKTEKAFEINKLKIKTSSQQRIKKILDHVCYENGTENRGIFKTPQPVQLKNQTRINSIECPLKNWKFGVYSNLKSLDENLKYFRVQNKSVGDRICKRIEEFVCIYMQTMEDVLNDLLKKNSIKDMLPPTTLQETLNCIKMVYNEYENIREIIYRLILYIEKCVTDKGHVIKSLKPDDFMKMFGCGVLLILALQSIIPSSEELKDTEMYLSSLLTSIETDCDASIEDPLKTPPVGRSDADDKYEFRPNFLKQPSYVLEYLKNHFKEWASYDGDVDSLHVNNNSDVKILRTVGKNLNLLKIDKNKSISMTQNATEGDILKNNNNDPQIFTFIGNQPLQKDFEKTTENINEGTTKNNINNTTNTLTTKDNQITNKTETNTPETTSKTDEPKVIRSVKIIDEYEKKIRQPLDLDLLDYSEIYEPLDDDNFEYDSVKENEGSLYSKNNENYIEDNKIININSITDNAVTNTFNNNYTHETKNENVTPKKIAEKTDFELESETFTEKFDESGVFIVSDVHNDVSMRNDNDAFVKDDETNDSGFENESTCAHMTVKIFFNELSSTFKAVSKFVTNFSEEIQRRGLDDTTRNEHHQKASKCLENLQAIILRLRNIIQREAAEVTVLKTLLLKAGLEATSDTRVTRYRQVVIKCLQQALILDNALKIIISTTAGDVDGVSCSLESIHSRYFNIFDN